MPRPFFLNIFYFFYLPVVLATAFSAHGHVVETVQGRVTQPFSSPRETTPSPSLLLMVRRDILTVTVTDPPSVISTNMPASILTAPSTLMSFPFPSPSPSSVSADPGSVTSNPGDDDSSTSIPVYALHIVLIGGVVLAVCLFTFMWFMARRKFGSKVAGQDRQQEPEDGQELQEFGPRPSLDPRAPDVPGLQRPEPVHSPDLGLQSGRRGQQVQELERPTRSVQREQDGCGLQKPEPVHRSRQRPQNGHQHDHESSREHDDRNRTAQVQSVQQHAKHQNVQIRADNRPEDIDMQRFLTLPDIPGYEGPMTIPPDDPINLCATAIEGERLRDTYWRNREIQRLASGNPSAPSMRTNTAPATSAFPGISRSVQPALQPTMSNPSPAARLDHIQSPQPIGMPQGEGDRLVSIYNYYHDTPQGDYRRERRVLSPIEETGLSDTSQGEQHPAEPEQQTVSPLPVTGRRVRFLGLEGDESSPEDGATHAQGSSPVKEEAEYEDDDALAAEDFERWVDLSRQDQGSFSETSTSQMVDSDSGSILIKNEAHQNNEEENVESILRPKPLTLRKASSHSGSSSTYSRKRSTSLSGDAEASSSSPAETPYEGEEEGGREGEAELDWSRFQSVFGDDNPSSSIHHTHTRPRSRPSPRPRPRFRSTSEPITTSTKHQFDDELARRREMYRRASKEYFSREMQRMREEAEASVASRDEAKTDAEEAPDTTKDENTTEGDNDLSLPIQNFDDGEEEEESLVDLRSSIFRDSRIPNRFVSAQAEG